MLTLTGEGWSHEAAPGSIWSFGRSAPGVDLPLADDPRLHRRCGTIEVGDDSWEIRNEGRWLRVRVVGLDRPGHDLLAPGEALVVPWRHARIEVHTGTDAYAFTAELPSREPLELDVVPSVEEDGEEATATPVRIDRNAGYFRALVALCEPQLVDPSCAAVATDLEIARRLNRSGRERARVSGKTVERRLDHCRTRFGLKESDTPQRSFVVDRRDPRRQLADVALLTATVTVDDLALLEPDDG